MDDATASDDAGPGPEEDAPSPPNSYRVLLGRLPERGLAELSKSVDRPLEEHEERIVDPAVERVIRLSLEADAIGPGVKRAMRRLLKEKGRQHLRKILEEIREANEAQNWMWEYVRDPDLLWEEHEEDPPLEGGGGGAGKGPAEAGDGGTSAEPGTQRADAHGSAGGRPASGDGGDVSGRDGDSTGPLRLLSATDPDARRRAIHELRGEASADVAQGLARTARDEGMPGSVRSEAAEALGTVPVREALEALLDLAVRQEGDFHSWRLAEKSPSSVAALEALSSGVDVPVGEGAQLRPLAAVTFGLLF